MKILCGRTCERVWACDKELGWANTTYPKRKKEDVI